MTKIDPKNFARPANYAPPLSAIDQGVLSSLVEPGETILEFGPGDTTDLFLEKGLHVTSCEHDDKWLEVARVRFEGKPVRFFKFENEMPVPEIEGMAGEQFDVGFVDSPQGYYPIRKIFKGIEDCSRLNTCIYALARCKRVLLHDARRGLERATLAHLHRMGYKFEVIAPKGSSGIAKIWHPQKQTLSTEPSEILELSPKEQVPMLTP